VRLRARPMLLADLWVLGLSVVLLWPQRLAGYGLGHDMVFTPHQPLTGQSLGLGSTAPRAVPLDALVALASRLIDGAVLGRIALLVPLLLAGWGCARLLRPGSAPALLAVAGFAVWNPYVVERLALGQWALLWAYGALPWLVRAAGRLGCRPGWRENSQPAATMLCCLACCAITPTGALVGAGVAVAVAASRRAGRMLPVLAAAVLVQLPWLVPALTSAAGSTSDPRAVAAFAARSERPGGALLSLVGLGGIWSADVTPASRAGLLGFASTAAVLAALVLGLPGLRLALGVPMCRRLSAVAGAGLLLAAAGTLPGLSATLRWAVRELPGAGLLRDGQKWLMPFVLLAVLATGAAVQRLVEWLDELPIWPTVLASLALPLVLLPDAPATLKAPLTPVRYPAQWRQVAVQVRGSGSAVLVLPFAAYRSYDWAPGRTVLDPAPRWLAAETVVDDRLVVSGTVLAGEDRRAQRVASLLMTDPPAAALARVLAGQGIGWVVRETDTPGPPTPELTGLQPVLTGGAVELFRVPGTVSAAGEQRARRWWVLLLDLLTAASVGVAIVVRAGFAGRRLLHSSVTSSSEDS
jgi:hypothetical protein